VPSLKSQLFRPVMEAFSARLDSMPTIKRRREFAGAAEKKQRLPKGATAVPVTVGSVPAEWITPATVASDAVILYLHGGGWILGWYNSHRWMVSHICQAASCKALAVDYRLAPEHPFPAALDDCVAAYRSLVESGTPPERIVIAGDSAGANLALATLMVLQEAGDRLPAAAVCLSPMTDLLGTGDSFTRQKRDALLSAEGALEMARAYYAENDPRLPLISPHYGDLTGLPPLLIQVGEDEILLDDSHRLAEKATAAGVSVELSVWPGMWHVWQTLVPYLPEAKDAVDAVGEFIRRQTGPEHQIASGVLRP